MYKLLRAIFGIIYFFDRNRLSKSEITHEELKRFLLISTTAIGDTLMSTPAIRAVRQKFPKSYIAVLADRRRIDILKGNPCIDRLITYHGKFKKAFSLIRELRKGKFDIVIILHANDPDIVPIAYLSQALYRIGWDESRFSFLLTHRHKRFGESTHAIDDRLDMLKILGIDSRDRHMDVFLSDEDRNFRQKLFSDNTILKDDLVIGLHPFGSRRSKWWGIEKSAELSDRLHERYGARVILISGKDEEAISKRIATRTKHNLILVCRATLRETAAVIESCSMFVTTDSGPMHIAIALGKPTVSLYGPSDRSETSACVDLERHIVVQKDVPCPRPCPLKECDSPVCMDSITVDEVMEAVETLDKGKHA